MNLKFKDFLDACIIGFISIFVGYLSGFLLSNISNKINNLPEICHNWNKNYIMEKTLFLTGFLIYIIFQITGINYWFR